MRVQVLLYMLTSCHCKGSCCVLQSSLLRTTSSSVFFCSAMSCSVRAKTRLGMESNLSVHEVLNTFDTLSEILLLLPPEETYKLILVSKRWLQIISSPFFRHAYLAKWKPNFHLIGFFISNTSYVGKKHVERVRRPRSESSMPLLSTSSLGDEVETSGALKKLGYYIDSSNGVLLCGRHPKAYYLWDPVTRKQHKIPRHRVHFEEVCMSLITEDCPVEGFSYKVVRGECVSYAAQSSKVRVEIYSSKTTTWSYSELACNEAVSLTPWTAGRVIKGVVYWYATGGKVAIYDTEDEEKRIDVIKLPKTFNYDEQVLGESSDGCLQYGWSNKSVMEIWELEKVGEVLEWSIQFKVNFKAMWRLNPVESARFSTRTKETQLLAFFNQNSDSVFIRCDSHIYVFDVKTQRVQEVQYQGRGSSFVWDYCKVLPYFQLSWPCCSSSLLEEGNQ
ncbi:F-box protein At5g03970 isoform X1 [Brassica rapa]|uniref:F-box protein At5g03970 isoform X1 n=1 Tax=Brassica campestris TaxID=3711 RepID=UPI00142E83BA|nr:F-box protein At5g03970 isoform X1 [Brassica rapa]